MAENNLFSFLQQSLRTVVGATTEAIETLQDTQKRNQAISELNQEWQKKSQEWAEKGSLTEA
jgi:cell shape-determining protein MreC